MNSNIDFEKLYKNEKKRYRILKNISEKSQNGGGLNENDYKIMYRLEKDKYLELKTLNEQDPSFISTYLSNAQLGGNNFEKQEYLNEKAKYKQIKQIVEKKQSGGQLSESEYKILYKEQKRRYKELKNK
jgi:hypothetical protein